jgi:hypothetical protein
MSVTLIKSTYAQIWGHRVFNCVRWPEHIHVTAGDIVLTEANALTVTYCERQGSGMHFPLRFAGGMGTETWPFWLDVPVDAPPGALLPP